MRDVILRNLPVSEPARRFELIAVHFSGLETRRFATPTLVAPVLREAQNRGLGARGGQVDRLQFSRMVVEFHRHAEQCCPGLIIDQLVGKQSTVACTLAKFV